MEATARQPDIKGCEECGTWWLHQGNATREDLHIIATVEERIGQLLGMAPHDSEDIIKVTSYKPKDVRSAYTLHHEKIGRPRRVATVLAFLTSVPAGHGGHTAFPAATTNGSTVHSFRSITPPRGPYWRIDRLGTRSGRGGVGLISPQATDAVRAAQEAADATCSFPGQGDLGLSVRPVRGTAVVWYHEEPKSEPSAEQQRADAHKDVDLIFRADPLAWHCGCSVNAGERWAMQKFKEHPIDSLAPASFYDVLTAHLKEAQTESVTE